MLSLIRVATLAGFLSVLVQGAVVLDGRQLGEPVHPHACTDLTTVASATDSLPLPTDGAGAQPIGTTGSPRIGPPRVTKRAKAFSPPLFTPIPIGTGSVGSPDVGGSCATAETDSAGEGGSTFTPGASLAETVQGTPVFTSRVTSQKSIFEGASAAPTTSTAQVFTTHAVTQRV